MNTTEIVLGDEAVALGAIDGGAALAYGYPGTPSTEIMEYLLRYAEADPAAFYASWCANEKTSLETAVGASYAGKRSIVTMKHVGLNVAMDAFVNACLVNIHGGLVLAVADDPGMHSSQNEQDTRYLAAFARTLCLEPRTHQQAYEMTREAFDLSERYHVPVVIRLVTRLSHSRSTVVRRPPVTTDALGKDPDRMGWMTLPALSRTRWNVLLDQQAAFRAYAESSAHNVLTEGGAGAEFAVISTGLGGNYVEENLAELDPRPAHLHLATYPIPSELIRAVASTVKRLVLVEEGYPFVEEQLTSILGTPIPVAGKLDGTVPAAGELNVDVVRPALGLPPRPTLTAPTMALPGRPPQLCAGCPHTESFMALSDARASFDDSTVTSDIGCYALSAIPPLNAVETILCMGASVGMARGAADAGERHVVATIGDSTFLHSGVTGLIDAAAQNTNMTLVILDNRTTGMTGGQDTVLDSDRIRQVVLGCGVDEEHVVVLDPMPKKRAENAEVIRREMAYPGLSVVILLRECVQTKLKRVRAQQAATA